MTSTAPSSPREWLTFPDPDDPEHEIRADLTWLLSTWTCIFGRGCLGINPDHPDDACCTHGAYFVDTADEKRVKGAAKRLTPDLWERHGTKKIAINDELDGEPARKTAVVDDVCVFFNRTPGDTYGCALHHLAEREGEHFMVTKPEVCWQVPVRREWEDLGEGQGRTTISEFARSSWGEGGSDLSWWCSSSTIAHAAGRIPVVASYESELRELIGDAAYDILREHCEARMASGGPVILLPLTEA
ncbi:MAG TPA: hypothetical protein VHX15_03090 [Frankiaceae bacterium]|nr:hypothetical protein [Frankiaceae bacterium]